MLLLYSLGTRFNIDSTNIDPLSMISPGFLLTRARITTRRPRPCWLMRAGLSMAWQTTAWQSEMLGLVEPVSRQNARLKTGLPISVTAGRSRNWASWLAHHNRGRTGPLQQGD
jgi:hypothetical protein